MHRSTRLLLVLALAGCATGGPPADRDAPVTPTPAPTPTQDQETGSISSPSTAASSPDEGADLVAAGDIAACEYEEDSATAALVAAEPDATVAALGDLVYPHGSEELYRDCYDPAWGAFADRLRPAMGNHDRSADDGRAFLEHFADQIGNADHAWYSFDLAAWHVIVLDSNCDAVGCGPDSEQYDWLIEDLADTDAACTLAYWHHPRFSSGRHGNIEAVAPFWDALHEAGADVVLAGHDHIYERFAPQTPDQAADAERGIRQFTVGTGGSGSYELNVRQPHSEHLETDSHGILRLSLQPDGYAWSFLDTDERVLDSGEDRCH